MCGTIFHYERKIRALYTPEIVTALGPITEAIYIVVSKNDKFYFSNRLFDNYCIGQNIIKTVFTLVLI